MVAKPVAVLIAGDSVATKCVGPCTLYDVVRMLPSPVDGLACRPC